MSPITLIAILDIESSLGELILLDNSAITLTCISNTCKIFNTLAKSINTRNREEYYRELPKMIENTIKQLVSLMLSDLHSNIDEIGKQELLLQKYTDKINDYYYNTILTKMLELLKKSIRDSYNNINTYIWSKIYRFTMIEYYMFIKCYMNYELTKDDFKDDITVIDMLYKQGFILYPYHF